MDSGYVLLNDKRAFTLVELAIVLVIIGLIVGGVLVGNDLIQAARIKSAISQITNYSAAVNTFRIKYSALPGDVSPILAANYGMEARSGADGHGDNDKILEACDSGAFPYFNTGYVMIGCETLLFWRDLSFAGLIDTDLNTATDGVTSVTAATVPLYFPRSKFRDTAYISVTKGYGSTSYLGTSLAKNYFLIGGMATSDAGGQLTSTPPALTTAEAYNFDLKMDDAMPQLGRVFGWGRDNAASYTQNQMLVSACGPALTPNCICHNAFVANYQLVDTVSGGNAHECHLSVGLQ